MAEYMQLYQQALDRLSTGGASLQASLQEIEQQKGQAISVGQASLVGAGLSSTEAMGGVPVQAEKLAGTARLAARGEAENRYLAALTNFAALAQQSEEARLDRKAAMERTKTAGQYEINRAIKSGQYSGGGGISGGGTSGSGTFGGGHISPGVRTSGLTGRIIDVSNVGMWGNLGAGGGAGGGGTANAQEFPNIYGSQSAYEPGIPDWTSIGTQETGQALQEEPETGSVPYGLRGAPTIEAPQGFWLNVLTNEKYYGTTKPTGGYAPAGWQRVGPNG